MPSIEKTVKDVYRTGRNSAMQEPHGRMERYQSPDTQDPKQRYYK